jgi:hypothetical protein
MWLAQTLQFRVCVAEAIPPESQQRHPEKLNGAGRLNLKPSAPFFCPAKSIDPNGYAANPNSPSDRSYSIAGTVCNRGDFPLSIRGTQLLHDRPSDDDLRATRRKLPRARSNPKVPPAQ